MEQFYVGGKEKLPPDGKLGGRRMATSISSFFANPHSPRNLEPKEGNLCDLPGGSIIIYYHLIILSIRHRIRNK